MLFAVRIAQGRPLAPASWLAIVVTGFFQTTINLGATTMALAGGGAGRTSVLVFTMPFWTLLIAWPVLHERVRGARWFAVAFAFAGLVVVVAPWHWQGGLASKLWAVLSGFGWAAGTVATKYFQRGTSFDPLNFMAWQMAVGVLPLTLLPVLADFPATRWSATYATRFVTQKAFVHGLAPIVVVNKVDRPEARPDWVVSQTFDLFDRLGASERQLDFPVVYTSALQGIAGYSATTMAADMTPLFETIVARCPAPDVDVDAPLQLQVSQLDYSNYVGSIGIGRIRRGTLQRACRSQWLIATARCGTNASARCSASWASSG